MPTWRERSAHVIAKALKDIPMSATEKEVRKLLQGHYPFGQREHHPYKAWCLAVKDALIERGLLDGKKSKTPEPEETKSLFE